MDDELVVITSDPNYVSPNTSADPRSSVSGNSTTQVDSSEYASSPNPEGRDKTDEYPDASTPAISTTQVAFSEYASALPMESGDQIHNQSSSSTALRIFCIGVDPQFRMDVHRLGQWMTSSTDCTFITGSKHGKFTINLLKSVESAKPRFTIYL